MLLIVFLLLFENVLCVSDADKFVFVIESSEEIYGLCRDSITHAKQNAHCAALPDSNIVRLDGCVADRPALGTVNAAGARFNNSQKAPSFIAPTCLDEANEIAKLSTFWKTPVVMRSHSSMHMTNQQIFPTLVNFSPSSPSGLALALVQVAALVEQFEMTLIGPAPRSQDHYPLCASIKEQIDANVGQFKDKVPKVKKYFKYPEESGAAPYVRLLEMSSRMIVVCADFTNVADSLAALSIRRLASQSYFVVVVCASPYQGCANEQAIGDGQVNVLAPVDDNFANNTQFFKDKLGDKYEPSLYSTYVSTYNGCAGLCWQLSMADSGGSFSGAFVGKPVTGELGEVKFDAANQVLTNYGIWRTKSGAMSQEMLFTAAPDNCINGRCFSLTMNVDSPLPNMTRVDGSTTEPQDVVDRRARNEYWLLVKLGNVEPCIIQGDCSSLLGPILAGVSAVMFALLLVAGYLYQRKRRLNVFRMHWKITSDQLKIIENKGGGVKGRSAADAAQSALSSKRRAVQNYAIIGQSGKAEFICLKQLRKIRWNKEDMRFLFELKQVTHDNVNKMMGVSCNDGDSFYIFHTLIERASLEDFILDPEFNLDITFRSAFLRDILKGLQYLHKSPIGYHGMLNAQNCLIDNNWVLKLTNFGIATMLNQFIANETLRPMENMNLALYTSIAPEHLANIDPLKTYAAGSPAGDVYSLGCLLHFVQFRAPVFDKQAMGQREILNEIVKGLRPTVEQQGDEALNKVMTECWLDPGQRPKLRRVAQTITQAFASSKGNLVDQMLKMNEKYAQNLEKIVAERNSLLQEAEAQSDRLLKEILPASVAEILKVGGTIPPRSYDSATVLFCQLVDFGVLLSKSNAEQIIQYLNDMFSRFDETIKRHDAYKVETTGETYMVASGVPNENDGRHVFEIAEISLDLREESYFYKVAWLPDYQVRVRVGFHCGPIAAGVIGLRSPRYCLFGDTVNFASRMQSNCPPNQIQTSEVTALKLMASEEYDLVRRGIVQVKGKGAVNCYWLNEHIHEEHEERMRSSNGPRKTSGAKARGTRSGSQASILSLAAAAASTEPKEAKEASPPVSGKQGTTADTAPLLDHPHLSETVEILPPVIEEPRQE